jgi:hypothetical protein
MLRIRLVLLGLMAMAAIGAVAAASASAAAPEFKLSATGKFPVPFNSTGKTAKLLTGNSKRKVECGPSTSTGEISGVKELKKVVIKFTGCTAEGPLFTTAECQSGSTKKEIVPHTAKGILVLGIDGSTKSTVVALEPETGGETFATFTCEDLGQTENQTVKGSVICEISPTGKLQKTSKLTCAEASAGKQLFTVYENSSGKTVKDLLLTEGSGALETYAAEDSAQVVTAEQASTEAVEIT